MKITSYEGYSDNYSCTRAEEGSDFAIVTCTVISNVVERPDSKDRGVTVLGHCGDAASPDDSKDPYANCAPAEGESAVEEGKHSLETKKRDTVLAKGSATAKDPLKEKPKTYSKLNKANAT